MPDYEIRYYRNDGTLAVVHVTAQPSERHAHEYARRNLGEHAHFELYENDVQRKRG
jgi:hypothetical protein